MKQRTSITNVAEKANVSIATVSNVINGKGRVSKKTVDRVNKVIKELGFSPSMAARNLKAISSHMIGVVVPTLGHKGRLHANPFYWDLVSGIEEGARDREFHVMLTSVVEGEETFSFVKERHLDGLIVVGGYEGMKSVEHLLSLDVPCVFVDSYLSNPDLYQVFLDDKAGGYMAAEHLTKLGHKRIAVITEDRGHRGSEGVNYNRYLGYKKALEEEGIPVEEELIFEKDVTTSAGSGYKVGREVLAKLDDVTAVITFSDIMAMGLMKYLNEHHINIPHDISVVGFDGLFFTEYMSPSLTTIYQDTVRKGQEAMQLLLDQIDGKNSVVKRKIVLSPELRVGGSTAPLTKKNLPNL
ncbi:LacI family DNA-binding transcriptional regulator [Bacillus taeanensis]|uniref:LacI family transcriptional regulator n=1 Tax=Bacillus taeanensis TaxID=273032 RepID=A0A366XXE7_9BACI|nr:LacI family DNA-binding transcriptional regulator [Bacillus taeanensis]RBW69825.1 LacI family transcriptional regulator [Bacillus taeanensis]